MLKEHTLYSLQQNAFTKTDPALCTVVVARNIMIKLTPCPKDNSLARIKMFPQIIISQ